jgi:hypothetical protein
MHALEEHKQLCKSESDYGSESSLRRHPSLGSLASTASASVASTGSFKVIKKIIKKTQNIFFLERS